MNDLPPDDTTQVLPTPEPEAQPGPRAKELGPEAAQWRKVAIVTSSLMVGALALLGWQLSSDNGPALGSQRIGGQIPGQQGGGRGGWSQDGQQGRSRDGQSQQGPPPMQGGRAPGGQAPGGQSQGGQSHQGPPTTGAS